VWVAAALLASGCGSDAASLQFQADASLSDPSALEGLRIEVDGQVFGATDFFPDQGGSVRFATRRFGVPGSGRLRIRASLNQGGSVVAQGEFTLDLQPRFEWEILVFRQASDPTTGCFGCSGKIAFPVTSSSANSAGEMLWLVWSGRERGSNIIL